MVSCKLIELQVICPDIVYVEGTHEMLKGNDNHPVGVKTRSQMKRKPDDTPALMRCEMTSETVSTSVLDPVEPLCFNTNDASILSVDVAQDLSTIASNTDSELEPDKQETADVEILIMDMPVYRQIIPILNMPVYRQIIPIMNMPVYRQIIPILNMPVYRQIIPILNMPVYRQIIPIMNMPVYRQIIPIMNMPVYRQIIPIMNMPAR